MVWPYANLDFMSEMRGTRLAGNTGRKNDAKITQKIAICAPSHNCVEMYFCN